MVPLLGVVLMSGALATLLGTFSELLPAGGMESFVFVMAKGVMLPADWMLHLYQMLCQLAERLPASRVIVGQPTVGKMLFYYVALACLLRRKTVFRQRGESAGKHMAVWIGMLALVGFLYRVPKISEEIDYLDVGQGDGIYMTAGDGYHFFIDGGSLSVKEVGTYRILPFLKSKGIRRMDYWMVSHADQDHVSGLKEVLESGYPIEHLVFSSEISKDEAYLELVELAQDHGTEVMYLEEGMCLQTPNAVLECLYPKENEENTLQNEDRNASSLVLLWKTRHMTTLFPGDLGQQQEEELIPILEEKGIDFVDVYKVAHHGSKFSNSEQLLQRIHPKIAVISFGENNSYGHPHEETLERLDTVKSRVFGTAECGEITITIDGKGEEKILTKKNFLG